MIGSRAMVINGQIKIYHSALSLLHLHCFECRNTIFSMLFLLKYIVSMCHRKSGVSMAATEVPNLLNILVIIFATTQV